MPDPTPPAEATPMTEQLDWRINGKAHDGGDAIEIGTRGFERTVAVLQWGTYAERKACAERFCRAISPPLADDAERIEDRRVMEAATFGEWYLSEQVCGVPRRDILNGDERWVIAESVQRNDGDFILRSRHRWRATLSALEAAEAENASLRESLQQMHRRAQQAEAVAEAKYKPMADELAAMKSAREHARQECENLGIDWVLNRSELERAYLVDLIQQRMLAEAENARLKTIAAALAADVDKAKSGAELAQLREEVNAKYWEGIRDGNARAWDKIKAQADHIRKLDTELKQLKRDRAGERPQ